jgi:uncharacterized protein (TIGR02145 family)
MKNISVLILISLVLLVCCNKETPSEVETLPPAIIDAEHVRLTGNVTKEGSSAVTARGFCWALTENPAVSGNFSQNESGSGEYAEDILVTPDTTYYVKAYATNSTGTTYGNQVSFKTHAENLGKFSDDRDKRIYKWVKIGTQVWMAENLAYLPDVSPSSTGSETNFHFYVNGYEGTDVNAITSSNYMIYGVLYNWPAAMSGSAGSSDNPSGIQGICPVGWHLPSDAEWKILEVCLGMIQSNTDEFGWRTSGNIEKKLKAIAGWLGEGNGNNSSGFGSLPGGRRRNAGGFEAVGYNTFYWSTSEADGMTAYWRYIDFLPNGVNRLSANKSNGLSVRCIRNQ